MRIYFRLRDDLDYNYDDNRKNIYASETECIDVDPSFWAKFQKVRQEFEAMSEKLWELAKKKEKENEAAEEEKDKPIAPAGLYAHRQRPYQESMSATRSIIILAIVSILEMAYIVFNIWIKNR